MKIVPSTIICFEPAFQASRPTTAFDAFRAVQSKLASAKMEMLPLLLFRVASLSKGWEPVVHVAADQFAVA